MLKGPGGLHVQQIRPTTTGSSSRNRCRRHRYGRPGNGSPTWPRRPREPDRASRHPARHPRGVPRGDPAPTPGRVPAAVPPHPRHRRRSRRTVHRRGPDHSDHDRPRRPHRVALSAVISGVPQVDVEEMLDDLVQVCRHRPAARGCGGPWPSRGPSSTRSSSSCPGSGHLPMHDDPELVVRVILQVTTAASEGAPTGGGVTAIGHAV
jgi:hypothetical protein